ncbi:hypothetical protein B6U90_05865 [Thermoplasmatales archaeon ex4484_6]|nr:MAG: hypothetical protein B6U90_05865 [Thermoplasmatales archaeon ex4484_6]RLF69377.1 MAG: hypothetical protein DRN57_01055 [Thermoplasmata archaeon]
MDISFIFAADIHGDISAMEALMKKGSDEGYPPLVLGGDLFRSGSGNDPHSQEVFLRDRLRPVISRYRGDVLTIFGNNDWRSTAEKLPELCPSILPLGKEPVTLDDGAELIGFSFVPPTPFIIKDWERPESSGRGSERGGSMNGLCSGDRGMEECSIKGRETIREELLKLGPLKGRILVSHGPPFGTCADISGGGRHLGSRDLTEIIREEHPLAVLSGHIHEAPFISGKAVCSMSGTLIANPGRRWDAPTCIIASFREGDLSLEHAILGK